MRLGLAGEGTKIGGWPSLIQSEIEWSGDGAAPDRTFVVQVDSSDEASLNLWDSGVVHLGLRGASDPFDAQSWVASAQFMKSGVGSSQDRQPASDPEASLTPQPVAAHDPFRWTRLA